MRHSRSVVALALVCATFQSALAQEKAKDATLAKIFADWKHRQGLFKTARWVPKGTTEFKDSDGVPPGDPVRPMRSMLLLDLEKKRYRLETSQDLPDGDGTFGLRMSTSVSNGKGEGSYLTHREINQIKDDIPDLVTGDEHPNTRIDGHLWPILYAHGLVDTVHTDIRMYKLPPAYDPEDFEVLGRQFLNDRECTVVRTEPVGSKGPVFDEFWIDPSEDSAIYRRIDFAGSNPWYRFDVEWKKREFGWWPEQWTLAWSKNNRVQRIYQMRVESFEGNPAVADSDFTFAVKPGMKVEVLQRTPPGSGLDPKNPASKTYVISPSGSWQQVSATGFTTLDGKQLPPERSWAWLYWIVASGLALGAVVLFLRRRQKLRGA